MNMLVPVLVISCLVAITQAIPGLTMDYKEFVETGGAGYEEAARCNEIARIVKGRFLKTGQTLPSVVDNMMDDMMLTFDQWTALEVQTRDMNRTERRIIDFGVYTSYKWELLVHYAADPLFTESGKDVIRASLDLWEKETCIRFVPVPDDFTGRYLYFVTSTGCFTSVGKTGVSGPQAIWLAQPGCMHLEIIPHEVGHALGLWHEQTRPDRDDFLVIQEDNIDAGALHNFVISPYMDLEILKKVPYDFASNMHYGFWFFADPGTLAMSPKDPLYISTAIGHNPRMTFFDAKVANLAYCMDICTPSALSCANAGYEDPNNCGNCRCLEGYTGQTCHDIDQGNSGHLPGCPRAGNILITPGSGVQCIDVSLVRSAPGYMECNWHIQTPHMYEDSIDFWITSINLTINSHDACMDFVEFKYLDLSARGPRFCGTSPPTALDGPTNFLTSDADTTPTPGEIMVNFASRKHDSPDVKFCFRTSPRCRITPHGTVISSAKADDQLDNNKKIVVAARGADDDPCKTRIVARTDGQGNLVWSAVSFGLHTHPKYPTKFFRNYGFNLQGKPGAWERGWQLKNDPVLMTFPYAGWNDGSVFVTVERIGSSTWRVEATCLGRMLIEYEFSDSFGDRHVGIKFGIYDDWTGECF